MNTPRKDLKLAAFALLVSLAIVANPELRILIMVVNALGLELMFFLLAIQLRSFSPTIRLALASARMWSCGAAFFSLRVILRVCGALSPGRALFGASVWLVQSKNLWCPLSRRSARALVPL
jgi:hypothetical protein